MITPRILGNGFRNSATWNVCLGAASFADLVVRWRTETNWKEARAVELGITS
jgi:hypothetical protein